MFGVGPEELMLILVVALLVLGPERLPKVARDLGKIVGDLRRTSDELRNDFLNADKYLEAKTTPPAQSAAAAASEGASGGGTAGSASAATVGPPGESAFDREMREARERLRGA